MVGTVFSGREERTTAWAGLGATDSLISYSGLYLRERKRSSGRPALHWITGGTKGFVCRSKPGEAKLAPSKSHEGDDSHRQPPCHLRSALVACLDELRCATAILVVKSTAARVTPALSQVR